MRKGRYQKCVLRPTPRHSIDHVYKGNKIDYSNHLRVVMIWSALGQGKNIKERFTEKDIVRHGVGAEKKMRW